MSEEAAMQLLWILIGGACGLTLFVIVVLIFEHFFDK